VNIGTVFGLFWFIFATSLAWADDAAEIQKIKQIFAQIIPGATPDIVSPSALEGLYEVVYGAQVLYLSKDGRYLMQGDVIDLEKRVNLTEDTRSVQRNKLVKDMNEATMIVFEPKGEAKYSLTVFTDIDCGYCRKLHREMEDYLAEGIRIRYLAFPRSGENSKSYFKAVSVWCADDRKSAMTEAKSGKELPRADCDNPVKEHMQMAEMFAITGTPTLVMESGEIVPGYVPAKRLAKMLGDAKKATM